MAIIQPTPEDVKAITGSTLDDATVQIFIDAATCIIEQVILCIEGKGIEDDCVTQAITFLAAHVMAQSGVGQSTSLIKRTSLENFSVEYAVGTYSASGILSTPYGNTANALTGGCLQEVDKRVPSLLFGG